MNLAEMLDAHSDEIVGRWIEQVQKSASVQGLMRDELVDSLADYLRALADLLGNGDDPRSVRREERCLELHVSKRLSQGFDLRDAILEFTLLGESVSRTWMAGDPAERPQPDEIHRFFLILNKAIGSAVTTFTHHLAEDEQAEKRLLRLLDKIATDALGETRGTFHDRLDELVEVVRSGMGADTAALFLYDTPGDKLTMAACVGIEERAGDSTTMLGSTSFVARVASIDETTVSAEGLLLGHPLRSRRRLVGVLYVGVGERRAFTASERRRMSVLAQRLALLIDNARLFQEREDSISRLETERDLRLKFVSILAHDLRGPLSAAKMAAQGIAHRPRAFEQQRELAIKVDRSVDRADRMIRDLLDVSRIHAGERLALRLEECDLGAVAHDVVTELESIHGQRFMLDADAIRGVWSCEELRRAIWNLSTNAVKYGAADRPVQITVKRVVDHACVSVHNEGKPLSWDEKENLFVPFSRTRSAEAGGPRGWGLGLTLVRGCVEAHGGSVDVESAPGEGTTFVLRFPLDARPYQPSDAAPSPSPPAPV